MKIIKKVLPVVFAALMAILPFGCTNSPDGSSSDSDNTNDELIEIADFNTGFYNTTATDSAMRTYSPVSGYSSKKYVGMFYFLWNGSSAGDILDISEYQKDSSLLKMLSLPSLGGTQEDNAFHYWGKPAYDYYRAQETWVIKKQVELFVNAGLDFICFDTTNRLHYPAQGTAVLDVLLEYQNQGFNVPKVMFMTSANSSDSKETVTNIYTDYYEEGKYNDLWFRGNGTKPWIIGIAPSNSTIANTFYFKKAQWPNQTISLNKNFPWIDWNYPQQTYKDDQVGGIMSVSVSQHVGLIGKNGTTADFSDSGLFAPYNRSELSNLSYSQAQMDNIYNANWGRGYDQKTGTNDLERSKTECTNFESQWQTVLNANSNNATNDDISLVFVTGWNEWIATKQNGSAVLGSNYGHFVDTFNMEFSRDIEISEEYLDNYYLTLVRNIRAFKGETDSSLTYKDDSENSKLFSTLNAWNEVKAVYKDFTGETTHRNSINAAFDTNNMLVNNTGRNDIIETRVKGDSENVYFLIRTKDAITTRQNSDTHFMNVFIGVNGSTDGFEGLQFVANRSANGEEASLQKIVNGAYVDFSTCKIRISGNNMFLAIKKSDLGIESDYSISFKVTDNLTKDFDILDMYLNGDCAPVGRIKYNYSVKG